MEQPFSIVKNEIAIILCLQGRLDLGRMTWALVPHQEPEVKKSEEVVSDQGVTRELSRGMDFREDECHGGRSYGD